MSLTRFYTNAPPEDLLQFIAPAVERLGHKYRLKTEQNSMRIAGKDKRKEPFKGSIEIEYFKWEDANNVVREGSRCVMKRDKVSGLCPPSPVAVRTWMLMISIGDAGESH